MELITNPKIEYLLDASLETLHTESREWLSQINFWRDEMACFYKLLHKSAPPLTFPTKRMAEIEKEMIRIESEDITRVKDHVESHERMLWSVVQSNSMTDEDQYRHRHRALVSDLYALQVVIAEFKRAVFALVRES